MLVLSVVTVLEFIAAKGIKGATGNIKNFAGLFVVDNLDQLKTVAKAFCFLAFHPTADSAVVDYVRSGSLTPDSGPNVLVLFTLDTDARAPTLVDDRSFASWVDLDTSTLPPYQLIRMLFEPKPVPPLPGLVFFNSLEREDEAAYVHLVDDHEGDTLRAKLRKVFSLADHIANRDRPTEFVRDLCIELQREHIAYSRTGRMSMREWLVRGYQFLGEHRGDIVSAVGLW